MLYRNERGFCGVSYQACSDISGTSYAHTRYNRSIMVDLQIKVMPNFISSLYI